MVEKLVSAQEEAEDRIGVWGYVWRTMVVVLLFTSGILMPVVIFAGIDINVDQNGHISYEIGNHPGRVEFTDYSRIWHFEHSAKMINAECKNPVWFELVSVASFEEVEEDAVCLERWKMQADDFWQGEWRDPDAGAIWKSIEIQKEESNVRK